MMKLSAWLSALRSTHFTHTYTPTWHVHVCKSNCLSYERGQTAHQSRQMLQQRQGQGLAQVRTGRLLHKSPALVSSEFSIFNFAFCIFHFENVQKCSIFMPEYYASSPWVSRIHCSRLLTEQFASLAINLNVAAHYAIRNGGRSDGRRGERRQTFIEGKC